MGWSLTAYGHTLTAEHEAMLIEDLRAALRTPEAGAGYATLTTQHHGQVTLLEPADFFAVEPAE